ncbi:hypothetical protein F5878DRAFT_662967 [Lentinula raphanica]|uniref:Uncharacterized protein n=1 Tax=Lentinula raphanica TaxID=153919 RepID=A0AA38P509_9AGAR|nr:hypothetical protein F5878DRAFT_662967 [Lentinula raphanica]
MLPKCSFAPKVGLLFLFLLVANAVMAAPAAQHSPIVRTIHILVVRAMPSRDGSADPDLLIPRRDPRFSTEVDLVCFEKIQCIRFNAPSGGLTFEEWRGAYSHKGLHVMDLRASDATVWEWISVFTQPPHRLDGTRMAPLSTQFEALTYIMQVIYRRFKVRQDDWKEDPLPINIIRMIHYKKESVWSWFMKSIEGMYGEQKKREEEQKQQEQMAAEASRKTYANFFQS